MRLLMFASVLAGLAASRAPAAQTESPRLFRGIVVDAATGDPLPGAIVRVLGTQVGSSTDLDGYFYVDLAPAAAQLGWPLRVEMSFTGLDTQSWTVPQQSAQEQVTIGLSSSSVCGSCYTGDAEREPSSPGWSLGRWVRGLFGR